MTTLWLSFADLKPGDTFRFAYNVTINPANPRLSDDVFVKGYSGWYRKRDDLTRRAYRTGRTSAVVLVPPQETP